MRNRMYGGVRGRKTKVGGKLLRFPPTRLCRCLGVTPHIYSISRSLLQSIAAARSGSAAVAAARGRAASSVVVLAVARHRALVGSVAVGVILLYAAFLAQLSVAPSLGVTHDEVAAINY